MKQQARILRSLLAQLQSKEAQEEPENSLEEEFSRLKKQSIKYRVDKIFLTNDADKQENIKKNRYKDIVPFDHSRVRLTLNTCKKDSDYINASFIEGISASQAYIATQGPLPSTVHDFLRMVWEYNVEVVVMACREFEMGRKKCERYWPEHQVESFVCEPFTVHCESEENKGDYLTRTLRVTYQNCCRTLCQLHYVNWPDHGVPDSIPPILQMLQEMRSYQPHDDVPICIHCSAGCGRTGVLCVIDYTWNLLKNQVMPADFSIYDLVLNMRTQRPSVVQTKEQYKLVYRAIGLLFERYLKMTDMEGSSDEPRVPTVLTSTSDSELSDLDEESRFDAQPRPESRHIMGPEAQQMCPVTEQGWIPDHVGSLNKSLLVTEGSVLPPPQLSPTSDNLSAMSIRDKWMEHQQQNPQQRPPQTILRPPSNPQHLQQGDFFTEVHRTSHTLVSTCQKAPILEENDLTPLKPPTHPITAICLTVEDPYFDSPVNSPLSEEELMGCTKSVSSASQETDDLVFGMPNLMLNNQMLDLNAPTSNTISAHSDEEIPPPLPMRTPESYLLSNDAENQEPCPRLQVIIAPNTANKVLLEIGDSGTPPSPVPPLPERTPESLILASNEGPPPSPVPSLPEGTSESLLQASDEVLVEHQLWFTPAVNRIGTSSEWSGDAVSTATTDKTKPWARSKSLKIKMNFTAASPVTHKILSSSSALDLHPSSTPLNAQTPPLIPQADNNLTRPPPDRSPESFILEKAQMHTGQYHSTIQTTQAFTRIGVSSEWVGTSQSQSFPDVAMNRSKSVRAESSRQGGGVISKTEPLTAVKQVYLPPVVTSGGGSVVKAEVGQAEIRNWPSPSTATTSNKSSIKAMSRTKSLKFFKHKIKPKTDPPPPPGSAPVYAASASPSKFGFGTRFGKPKGPRSRPETWV